MKKISINLRLFLWFSALVLLVFFTIWISNTIILEKYYQFYKEESLAKTLLLIADKIKRKTSRSLTVVDVNGGKPELIKRDLIDINLYVDDIKNLASDLRADARL